MFGLTLSGDVASPTVLRADQIDPALPRKLKAGRRWAGSIGGAQSLPRGRPIRVVLGSFTAFGDAPPGFRMRSYSLFVSDHALTLSSGDFAACTSSLLSN